MYCPVSLHFFLWLSLSFAGQPHKILNSHSSSLVSVHYWKLTLITNKSLSRERERYSQKLDEVSLGGFQ
jgi:hypothetical protein